MRMQSVQASQCKSRHLCLIKTVGRRDVLGLSLIELMIAMTLGVVVIAGVGSVFLANKQSYRSAQALGEVQDATRVAFELMARDMRQAGLVGCGNTTRVANVVNGGPPSGGTDWWLNWGITVIGYDGAVADPAAAFGTPAAAFGTDPTQRVAGTDSVHLIGEQSSGLSVATHTPSTSSFTLNEAASSLRVGDIIIMCDPDHAAITQITAYTHPTVTAAVAGTPGNCSGGLGFPTNCATPGGNSYAFAKNSQLALLNPAVWYIGNNPVGGRSLYRSSLVNTAGVPAMVPQEMVRNVTDLQLRYVDASGSLRIATAVTDWGSVRAIQVELTVRSEQDRVSTGSTPQPLVRSTVSTVTLRNRVN